MLDEHNIESRYAEATGQGSPRELARLRRWERLAWRDADLVTTVTDDDAAEVARWRTGAVAVVPNGVAAREIAYIAPTARSSRTLLFVGAMSHAPNIAAATELVREVLPTVRAQHPEARVVLCGRAPSAEVRALASPHVTVTGTVADVAPYLADAGAFVCLLRAGAGSSLKVPEALAAGVPLVTTELGARGFGLVDGVHGAVVRTAAEARAAAEEVGFPLILKPIAGAGSADTYAVASPAELEEVLPRLGNVIEASCEEYIDGDELTFDTVCMRGEPVYENVSLYLPKPLEASKVEWLSPISISIRDLERPDLAGGIALGRAALQALGMQDGFTHMEWYRTSSGEAVFGEVACRAGGAGLVDQMNYTSDIDLYREWARVTCWGHFEARAPRKYNTALVFKRARGWGNITRIEGLHGWLRACGPWVVEERLSRPGTPRRDWKQTQRADGHIFVRHPDWDTALDMARSAAADIQIYAQ